MNGVNHPDLRRALADAAATASSDLAFSRDAGEPDGAVAGVPEPSGDHSAGRPPVGAPGLDPVVSGTDGGIHPNRHIAG